MAELTTGQKIEIYKELRRYVIKNQQRLRAQYRDNNILIYDTEQGVVDSDEDREELLDRSRAEDRERPALCATIEVILDDNAWSHQMLKCFPVTGI